MWGCAVSTLAYTTQPVPLHHVKPGARIEHDGHVYKVFRFLRVARPHKPLGCVAIAVPLGPAGEPLPESVALCFDDTNEVVRLVCGTGVPR